MPKKDVITIKGARVHNLQDVDVDIPKEKLVVISGISGSGKSSLAFDTIYAEGQRRYVESLSAYARQFLGIMDKPDVDSIDGLSPAISIDQKSVSKNPRSTVGTITEIHDYLRLLYARVGIPHCPECDRPVSRQSVTQITDQILDNKKGTKLIILAPLVKDQKGEHKQVFERVADMGYPRVRVDGEVMLVNDAKELELERYQRHNIDIVIDRVEIGLEKPADERARVAESVEQALNHGEGMVYVRAEDEDPAPSEDGTGGAGDQIFSESLACAHCNISMPDIEPRTFSFNSPHGACPHCTGLGYTQEINEKLAIPNKDLTVAEGAIHPWATASHRVGRQSWYMRRLKELADKNDFSLHVPASELSKEVIDVILYGEDSQYADNFTIPKKYEGVVPNLQRRWKETESEHTRKEIEEYMTEKTCPVCDGRRLRPEALAVTVAGKSIDEVLGVSIAEAHDLFTNFFKKADVTGTEKKIATPIVKEVANRLTFLMDVGLSYLTLLRSANTLSGGEAQRIRLATQIGSGLTGVLYILDEPSIGLHQRDQERLITTLKQLRDLGNTVIVVEHDEQTIDEADWVIEVGPGAGKHGGEIVFEGTPAQLKKTDTVTGQYMSGKKETIVQSKRQAVTDETPKLIIKGASEHNLKNITVPIPLEQFVAITGVSGSGKSTLMNTILARALKQHFYDSKAEPGAHKRIKGKHHLDKVIVIDQSPIGRTPRSNPATYTGVFTPIRQLFAETNEAQVRGYKQGRFSFNVKGGRCEECEGQGVNKIEMHFLPDLYVECEECKGTRYNKEALEITYKEKTIADILSMTVEEALVFFKNIPAIHRRLKTMKDVGLDYLELGQSATTLSGGEAQRIKLSTELAKTATGHTLYILDEPTTGLHFDDINKLLNVLHRLKNKGNTVLVIEHNLDVIRTSDYVIDLGPEGGKDGGEIIATGTPKEIKQVSTSYTGQYLKRMKS